MEPSPLSVMLVLMVLLRCGQTQEIPTLRVEPEGSVFTGDTVTLSCETQSTGAEIFWMKDSQYFIPDLIHKDTHTTTVRVTVSDPGDTVIMCVDGESYSFPVKIRVRARQKPTVKVQPAGSMLIGERVTLTCEIESEYEWNYEWNKNAESLSYWKKDYIIFNVGQSDAGVYTCKGTRQSSDRIHTHISDALTLTVSDKPTLRVEPEGLVFTGDTVTLSCEKHSTGAEILWLKNSQILNPPLIPENKLIDTVSVTMSDPGETEFRCEVRQSFKYYSDPIKITVRERPKPTVKVHPAESVFIGERVTLTCEIRSGDWNYSWYKNNFPVSVTQHMKEYQISVKPSDAGVYTCKGRSDRTHTHTSDAVTLTVSGVVQAVLSVSPQSWLTEGDSVTLSCEVPGSAADWTFSWYRAVPLRQGLTPVTDAHGTVMYYVELLSDSRRGAGGSYTLSPAALNHTGVYVCGAERGEPLYHTQHSRPHPLWITGKSPPVSLIISPSRTQHFSADSLSLSCEGQRDSTGWRVKRYTHSEVSDCSTDTGFTCNISSLSTSYTGVYWCQSESGEGSDPVNVTVYNGDVILESPVHPVTEGDPLTLRCLFRSTKSSPLPVDFYKNGSLFQNQTTGEMTIHEVSRSDEGLYHCKHPEKGESPQSWISVRGQKHVTGNTEEFGSEVISVLSRLMAVSPYVISSIVLGVKCYRARVKPDEEDSPYAVIEAR